MFRVPLFRCLCIVALLAGPQAALSQEAGDSSADVERLSSQAASFRKIIAELDSESRSLQEALAAAHAELDAVTSQMTALTAEREEMAAQVSNAEHALDTTNADIEAQQAALAELRTQSASEAEAAQERLDELNAAILDAEARASAAQARVDELTAEQVRLTEDLSRLEVNLAERKEEYVATASLVATAKTQEQELADEAASLRSELQDLGAALEDARVALAETESRITEAQAREAEALAAAEVAVASRDAALMNLGKIEARTEAARSDLTDLEGELERAGGLLDSAKREVRTTQSAAQEAEARRMAEVQAANDTIGLRREAEASLAALARQRVEAEAAVAGLRAEIEAMRGELSDVGPPPPPAPQSAAAPVLPAPRELPRGTPKSSARVADALASAPGLSGIDAQDRQRLATLLEDGVCTHAALAEVVGQINRQTLLSLIRDLGRC